MLIGVGVRRVVAQKRYHSGQETEFLLKEVGIELIHISEEVETYGKK